MVLSVPSIGVIGKSALEIGQFLRRNFWMISGGPFLSRPLWFTVEERTPPLSSAANLVSLLWQTNTRLKGTD